MKRYLYTLLAAGLVMTSCAVNEIQEAQNSNKGAQPIYASTEADSKTALGDYEDGRYKVYWNEGDQILVANNYYEAAIYTSQEGGTSYAEFLPDEGYDPMDFSEGVMAGYPEKNMYLYSADPNEAAYFTIPDVQTYYNGTFDDTAMPMISDVAYDNQLKFNNAAGLLKLMLSAPSKATVQSIVVKAENEFISGECGYIPESKSYFFDETMISKNKVTLNCGNGVAVTSDAKPFFIVVPHQEYTSLTITVTTKDGLMQKFSMKEDKVLNVQRSAVLNIPLYLDNLAAPTGPNVKMSAGTPTFKGFTVSIEVQNASAYFCNLQTKRSYEADLHSGLLLESLPYATPYDTPLQYSGSILNYRLKKVGSEEYETPMQDVLLEPGETYILWFVIYNEEGVYTEDDIFTLEIKMKSFTPGGSIAVSTSEHDITMNMIRMKVSANNAMFIYSQLLPNYIFDEYNSEEELIELLLKPGGASSRFDKSSDYFERRQLRPGAEMTFISIAVDNSGRYGPLYIEPLQTIPIEYNSLVVEIEKDIDKLKENGGVLNWSVSEGEAASYRYFYRRTDNNYWTNTFEYDYTMIQEKMVMDPYVFYINHTKDNFATLNNPALEEGVEYVFVVLAVADDETCSEADHWIFTY